MARNSWLKIVKFEILDLKFHKYLSKNFTKFVIEVLQFQNLKLEQKRSKKLVFSFWTFHYSNSWDFHFYLIWISADFRFVLFLIQFPASNMSRLKIQTFWESIFKVQTFSRLITELLWWISQIHGLNLKSRIL